MLQKSSFSCWPMDKADDCPPKHKHFACTTSSFAEGGTMHPACIVLPSLSLPTLIYLVQRRNFEAWFLHELPYFIGLQDIYYWSLPPQFLGNKLDSYGGSLDFILQHSNGSYVEDPSSDPLPLVILLVSWYTVYARTWHLCRLSSDERGEASGVV